mmetsp:Transcript_7666/g.12891  ORF Transcript_7666/g.12891 Transcript_7666/m.12891 type:complete len:873 (-) Transcript_7666:110-2728(-)
MAVSLPKFDILSSDENNIDMVLQELVDSLGNKGYSVSKTSRPDPYVSELQAVAGTLPYTRVPLDFEPFYLGTHSKEKTALLDFEGGDVPMAAMSSPLAAEDAGFTDLCGMLGPHLETELGIKIATRTNLLVRQTFSDSSEETSFPPASEPSEGEKEAFMGLMKRKRVCVMNFLGPLTSTLTLTPKGDGEQVTLSCAPGTSVMFLTERFSYNHQCAAGATTVVQCWFLARAPQFQMQDVGGDFDVIAVEEKGKPVPKGNEQVCVTGLSSMMGGDCKDHLCFWLAVNKAGADTACQFPITRFDMGQYVHYEDMQVAMTTGKSYTKHQGYVDGIEYFDGGLFAIATAESRAMDPNQRKCLETAYSCMYTAGHTMQSLKSKATAIGAFVGISGSEWGFVPHDADAAGCGGAEAIIANRLNFVMNMKGPSVTSNTACSAGLTAINIGKLWLKYKDYDPLDASVGGGIQLAFSPFGFIGCCSGSMLSYKGRCWTFDVTADGYLRGEGSTFVYITLKGYEDDVFAIFIGGQSNQDGRSASITAPNGPSQEKCIKAALREAAVAAPEVDCFECHGTGTALGDPIEVGAFKRIYTQQERVFPLSVTTSKTMFGHSEGGAGSCGFLKCCLQVQRCEASAGQHLREMNAHLDVAGFPAIFLNEGLCTNYDTSMCGVSSFGFGGTNGHSMAYSANNTTSRSVRFIDYRRAMLRKIEAAVAPDILTSDPDPETWESTGMPVGEVYKPTHFQVELDAKGKVIWREMVEELPSRFGDTFKISGSFNSWDTATMEEDLMTPGLFTAEVKIGQEGFECFFIVADDDANMVYYPDVSQGSIMAAPVKGPEMPPADRESNAWVIQDEPGVKYCVEFYRTDFSRAVQWKRLS